MSRAKLLAFLVMLAIFIPLIAVPEVEENPFSHPTFYEEKTTPIKDYNIVSALKDLEDTGVATAVFQPDMDELEEGEDSVEGDVLNPDIRDLSGLFSINKEPDVDRIRSFIETKLTRFRDAKLNPSYFIVPEISHRYLVSDMLDELSAEMEMTKVQLMVKNGDEELSTGLLEYLYDEAAYNTRVSLDTPEGQEARDDEYEGYVTNYLNDHKYETKSILTIDTQNWNPNVADSVDKFLDITEKNEIDIVVRIENISKVTSGETFNDIITTCKADRVGVSDGPGQVEDVSGGTRGGREPLDISSGGDEDNAEDTWVKLEGRGHVQEIILGAMPEYSESREVDDNRFTLVIDVIDGFYYVILITCVLPNVYFVAWAGFIRRDRNRAKQGQEGQKPERPGEDKFNNRLKHLEQELGNVILFNNDKPVNVKNTVCNNPYDRNKASKLPVVSIIVPCYNEEKGVALTVEKCFNQTYPGRIEVLVIDDGSRDYTLRIAKIFEGPFPNRTVRVFHKPNGGKADALNHGFERASGQIILTTDGDSHMDLDAVEALVRGYRVNPHAGVVGGFVVIRNEKESPLVKLQQIEYIFTQDVFRLPQSDSASVLIVPGPVFSLGNRVAKNSKASTRTCVEDADLTHNILADDWGTVAVTDATAHTQAPTTWKAWYKQRKRWVYGQFQVWRENRKFLKRNFWGVYNYFTWLSSIFITAMLITSTLALLFIGEWNFFSLLITAQTSIIFALYFLTRGISLMRYKYGRHLLKWLPLQVVYDLVNGVLCAYLFLRYLLGRGIKIKFGPELVTIY